jgi:chaperonin GroES
MKAKPLYDKLIIKLLDSETTLKSGLVIPDNNQEKPNHGKVISAGIGRLTKEGDVIPTVIKEGYTVMYHKFAGQPIKVDGEEFVVIKEDDVLIYTEE